MYSFQFFRVGDDNMGRDEGIHVCKHQGMQRKGMKTLCISPALMRKNSNPELTFLKLSLEQLRQQGAPRVEHSVCFMWLLLYSHLSNTV